MQLPFLSMKAMPPKDLTSDGQSTFSMYRRQYSETINATPSSNQLLMNKKKWIGGSGNRDASVVAQNNSINQVGNGTLNASRGAISFTTHKEVNTEREALRRVRSGGANVPKKCTKNINVF